LDAEVVFKRNDEYWGQVAGIETLTAVQYETTDEVETALKNGDLDMALGIGPLDAAQVQDLKFYHSDQFDVRHSDVIQHSLLVFNSNRAPTDDITVRRAIIHAIDKAAFLEKEFANLEQPVNQLLPYSAPYCNVDLSPKWGYDLEKAQYLNCELGNRSIGGGAVAGIVVACAVGVGLVGLVVRMIQKERQGKPVFAPVEKAMS
jgi:nickel transport system substrate-binding protein